MLLLLEGALQSFLFLSLSASYTHNRNEGYSILNLKKLLKTKKKEQEYMLFNKHEKYKENKYKPPIIQLKYVYY